MSGNIKKEIEEIVNFAMPLELSYLINDEELGNYSNLIANLQSAMCFVGHENSEECRKLSEVKTSIEDDHKFLSQIHELKHVIERVQIANNKMFGVLIEAASISDNDLPLHVNNDNPIIKFIVKRRLGEI